MKSFLELYEEETKTHKPVVMAFGRMNPPTTGHLKLIDKVRELADKHNAQHEVVVSHSQDSKKNPLSGEQKVKHLKRYSPGTNFTSASKEEPTLLQHAARLHAAGHDHLIMVAGSDRVKEYHDLLHRYNGKPDKNGKVLFNFKKIEVKSAGHRDPDAEGAEGMSGTKMREHAKQNDFSSFRQGVPSHVSDYHAKELMHDVRKGMGLNEDIYRGQFKAIFVTGGPGSGKDILIREAIAESKCVELNFIQATDYLADKQKLSESSRDFRREAIRNRSPLIINGPADDIQRIGYIREELEELGYDTLMIFVNTSNEASKERNSLLSRMMVESVRQDKWLKSQENNRRFLDMFENFMTFDNTGNLDDLEEDIHDVYQSTKLFLDSDYINESVNEWFERNSKIDINKKINTLFKEDNYVKESTKTNKTTIGNKREFAAGPADITPDNRAGGSDFDSIKGNTNPRKNPNGKTYTFGQNAGVYAEAAPQVKWNPPQKEPKFNYDNDKNKKLKKGDSSGREAKLARPDGVGSTYDTRGVGGINAGLGENQEYSNANPASTAMPSGGSPNPLSSDYAPGKKDFKKFRKSIKEDSAFSTDTESGVGGVLGGSSNKEGMDSYKDPMRNIGIEIKKKKKKGV
ncbi:Cytidyltransferase-like domain [uncultured Caudovirales phage]|uniref:Cytidyltransferase-like domain n=1 Tax=uncultured Caudovirales phage TaxID=2100421 RepID=A0A6J5LF86_9CAUD|nr:Cytidyltransferase-like domain [uncultured Caudovirales phage]